MQPRLGFAPGVSTLTPILNMMQPRLGFAPGVSTLTPILNMKP